MTVPTITAEYEQQIAAWHAKMEASLRGENGWLKLAGLFWLHEGDNTVGSAPDSDILLPAHSAPAQVGIIHFENNAATFRPATDVPVLIDGASPVGDTPLKPDTAEGGASILTLGSLRFYMIQRVDQYGIRIIDSEHAALQTFGGRKWYPLDPAFHVEAKFTPHAEVRTLSVVNSVGLTVPMENPGYVEFTLADQVYCLEAFDSAPGELWFIFKDRTNGDTTYGAGRFLTAPLDVENRVDLDFNKSYSPPCAFTEFATCPFPPRENHLPIRIEAGELVESSHNN
jgi:hypothetical protein